MKMQWAMKLPEAWRLLRAGTNKGKNIGYILISAFVCLLITGYVIAISTPESVKEQFDTEFAIRMYILLIFYYHCLLWLAFVPMFVSNALVQEFSVNTWVFQQTTPQPAHRLLLGKILGAPISIYMSLLGGLPFLIAALLLKPTLAIPLIFSILFLIVFSFALSSLFLCISSDLPGGNQTTTTPIMMIVAVFVFFASANVVMDYQIPPSACIHPLAAISELDKISNEYAAYRPPFAIYFADDSEAVHPKLIKVKYRDSYDYEESHDPANHVDFYGVHFGVLPFDIVFYLILGWCFFFAAEGALLRKMSMGQSRIPILIPLLIIVFFIHGLTNDLREVLLWGEEGFMFIVFVFWFMFMYIALRHARTFSDLRPWLYYRRNETLRFADYFRDDAPVIYSTLLLLPFMLVGLALIMLNYNGTYVTWKHIAAQVSVLGVIILRDTLLIQMFRLTSKKPDLRASLFYGIVFIGITFISAAAVKGEPILDLTPYTALFFTGNSDFQNNVFEFVYEYLTINGILALLFGTMSYKLLKKKLESFRIEDEIPRAA